VSFPDLVLTREGRGRSRRRRPRKGREFRVTLLGYLEAPWELSRAERVTRPVWIAYAGPDQACRAFTANFRAGRKAECFGTDLQVPKSAPHRWVHHRHGDATVTVAYLPELFHLDPAVPPDRIEFLFMPPAWWLERQAELLRPELGGDAFDAARAALFVAFLDRRTSLPVVHDLRFHLQLYRAALEKPWCRDGDDHHLAPASSPPTTTTPPPGTPPT
jgi:hypothetical protein